MSSPLIDSSVARLVQIALAEDIGHGDISSEAIFSATHWSMAEIVAKDSGIVCGLPIAKTVFQSISQDVVFESSLDDGDKVRHGKKIATIHGPTIALLAGERTALNFMQRLSGIASLTSLYVAELEGLKTQVLDTRKTSPGWRLLEKYAVRTGGGRNHRMGLFDMAMIKDNHIDAAGSIHEAVRRVREYNPVGTAIEVEARTIDDVKTIVELEGVTRVMFDNFSPDLVRVASMIVNNRIETEASGGIVLNNIRQYAQAGVDFVSVGALTHSATALDISMYIKPLGERNIG